jgi:hypothetical protein
MIREPILLGILIVILSSCSNLPADNVNYAVVKGKKIPIINLGLVDQNPSMIGWSSIFEDVDIIPLETDAKCMIMNWMTGLSPNSLYLATQTCGIGPVRLMEFDFKKTATRFFLCQGGHRGILMGAGGEADVFPNMLYLCLCGMN